MTVLEDRVNPTPTVSAAFLDGYLSEGGSSGTLRLTRSDTTGSLTAGFAITGTAGNITDFTVGTMFWSVNFASGVATADVTITPVDDSSIEGTETFQVDVTPGGGAYNAGSGTGTINLYDNDNAQVTVAKQGSDPTEGSNGTFRITRTGSTSGNLTVNLSVGGTATSGTDFTSIGTSATITSGNSYVDVTVPTLADNLVEGDEMVSITLADGGSSYTALPSATASLTISDDPPVISMSRLNDGEEGGSDGAFRVSRTGGDISQAFAVTYTIGGTADDGDDYTSLTGSVTIAASASYADVVIDVTNDSDTEGTETVSLTLDTDDDWINGNATDTLFIWDNEGTFVHWTGAEDDVWMNADNWSGSAVPDGDDIVIFDGSYVGDVTLSGPLSPCSIGELRIASSYTGTITLSFPLSVGSLNMAGGTIDQPYSAYGSDLTVTGAAVWTGGVLNSTANVASVIFDGSMVAIRGTVSTGSDLVFLDSTGMIDEADIDCGDGSQILVSGTSVVAAGVSGGSTGHIKVDGGTLLMEGTWTIQSLYVLNGGTVTTKATGGVFASARVPISATAGILVEGGDLNIQNGTVVSAASNNVEIYGTTGMGARAANLNTYASSNRFNMGVEHTTITAGRLVIGSSGSGDATVTIAKDALNPNPIGQHRYSTLDVNGPVDWIKGTFVPTVSDSKQTRDWWNVNGVVNVNGSTAVLAPTGTTTLGREEIVVQGTSILASDGKSTTLPSVATINWDWSAGTAYGAGFWKAKIVT